MEYKVASGYKLRGWKSVLFETFLICCIFQNYWRMWQQRAHHIIQKHITEITKLVNKTLPPAIKNKLHKSQYQKILGRQNSTVSKPLEKQCFHKKCYLSIIKSEATVQRPVLAERRDTYIKSMESSSSTHSLIRTKYYDKILQLLKSSFSFYNSAETLSFKIYLYVKSCSIPTSACMCSNHCVQRMRYALVKAEEGRQY